MEANYDISYSLYYCFIASAGWVKPVGVGAIWYLSCRNSRISH
ncbi:Uncharacterised protein [Salmonella bongori]|nr:Uncharacterised protein [Salmonella bongori]